MMSVVVVESAIAVGWSDGCGRALMPKVGGRGLLVRAAERQVG